MNIIVIGNAIALAGSLIMVGIGLIKKKGHILAAQCVQFVVMGIANLILGGMTGFISNMVSVVRNLYCFRFAFGLPAKLIFIVIQAAISLYVNDMGLIGLLPVFAAILFTWFLDTPSELVLKSVILVCQVMWVIYDLCLYNFSAAFFDVLTFVSTVMGMWLILKSRKNGE